MTVICLAALCLDCYSVMWLRAVNRPFYNPLIETTHPFVREYLVYLVLSLVNPLSPSFSLSFSRSPSLAHSFVSPSFHLTRPSFSHSCATAPGAVTYSPIILIQQICSSR